MRAFSPGLRFKILALLSIILLVIFATLTYILIRQNTTSLRDSLNEKTKAYATLATPPIINTFLIYQNAGSLPITEQTKKYYGLDRDIEGVGIINTDGAIQYWYGKDRPKKIDLSDANGFDPIYTKDESGIVTKVIQPYVEDYGGYRYASVYRISSQSVTKQITEVTTLLAGTGAVLGIITLGIIYLAINRLYIRPVREVSRLARVISAGNLDQEISIKSKDEIGDLSHAVNDMANTLKADILALQESDKLKNEFIMITSHNLRTPLTVIEGYTELIETLKTSKKFQEFLDIIKVNTNKLKKLTEDMLTIATVESGGNLTASLDVDLKSTLDEVISDFEGTCKQKNIILKTDISLEKEKSKISKPHLKSALWNILDNAIKFTPNEGRVDISANVDNDSKVVIIVKDQGPGIPKEELPLLFTKFHRGTSTLEYNYEGVGLGLYVTKIILDQFHGSIDIDSTLKNGTTVTITLPLSEQHSE